jgi:predicted peptidase
MKFFLFISILLVTFGCSSAPPRPHVEFSKTEFLERSFESGGELIRYRVYLPSNRAEGKKLPVMLYLHGSDERGSDNEGQLSGPAPSIEADPAKFDFIIVFPQCPAGRFWDKQMIEQAVNELDRTVSEFDGDEKRLYLAGFSLGGYGVWHTAAMYPDKFAAVVPMSGRVLPRPRERNRVAPELLELADEKDPYLAFAERLRKTPIWIFHGDSDPIVPVSNSREMEKALQKVGNANAHYTELKNTGHISLTAAFSDPELFKWLAEH